MVTAHVTSNSYGDTNVTSKLWWQHTWQVTAMVTPHVTSNSYDDTTRDKQAMVTAHVTSNSYDDTTRDK